MKNKFRKHSIYSHLTSSQPSDDAAHLFERAPSEDSIKEWTDAISQPPPVEQPSHLLSVLVFRLGHEWLALPTIYFKEVTHRRPMHHIPHRSGKILQGVVNLNGELELYVALHALLEIDTSIKAHGKHFSYQYDRMIAIMKEGELWVFPVDEIDGIYAWNLAQLENVPINVSKSTANYIKGIMKVDNRSVGLLDEELLFSSLKRSLQ